MAKQWSGRGDSSVGKYSSQLKNPEISEHFRCNIKLIFPDNEDPLLPCCATEIDLCIADVNIWIMMTARRNGGMQYKGGIVFYRH